MASFLLLSRKSDYAALIEPKATMQWRWIIESSTGDDINKICLGIHSDQSHSKCRTPRQRGFHLGWTHLTSDKFI